MDLPEPKYKCPACRRAILNRKAGRCLYCGQTLPAELLFSEEEIAEQNRQKEESEKRGRQDKYTGGSDAPGSSMSVWDVLDIASDIGDLFD